jgi:hypothetical protein
MMASASHSHALSIVEWHMRAKNLAPVFVLMTAVAHAQTAGVVNLSANESSAQTSMTPVLTWSTSPAAQSCLASGGWSGGRAVSGTETLPSIDASTSYTLTCNWGDGTATVSWIAPTTNADGSDLLDLAGFKVAYGTDSNSLTQTALVDDNTRSSYTLQSLTPGTWYFAVRAFNTQQVESVDSNVAQKEVTGGSAAKTVAITISPAPPPPPPPADTLHTTATPAYDVQRSGSRSVLGRQVGAIALGKPCVSTFRVGSSYYQVTRSDVSITRNPRSQTLVARCATS